MYVLVGIFVGFFSVSWWIVGLFKLVGVFKVGWLVGMMSMRELLRMGLCVFVRRRVVFLSLLRGVLLVEKNRLVGVFLWIWCVRNLDLLKLNFS